MVPTAVDKDYISVNLAWYNGTTSADGSYALYLRGDTLGNYINAASCSAAHALTWGGTSWDLKGTVPDAALSRITGAAWRFTYNAVGDIHDIVFNVMELPPHTKITAGFTNFPSYTNVTPNTSQREVFNARSFMLRSGETVQLTAYPMDTRATDFLTHNATRGESSLSSYVVWWFGGRNTDQMVVEASTHWEFVVPSAATAPTATFNTAVVKPDTNAFDKAMSMLTDAQAVGLNVVKAPSGTVSSVFDSVLSTINSALKSSAKWGFDAFTSYMFGGGLGGNKWAPYKLDMLLAARGRRSAPLHLALNERFPWQTPQRSAPTTEMDVLNDRNNPSIRFRSQSVVAIDSEEEKEPVHKPPSPPRSH